MTPSDSNESGRWHPSVPLLDPLFDDLMEYQKLIVECDSQFARRGSIRAQFAYIEALTWWFQGQVLKLLWERSQGFETVPLGTVALLSDESYRADEVGKVKKDSARLPIANSIAFVIRTYAEMFLYDAGKLFGDNGWNQLKKAIKVRHRITHPKKLKDLEIQDGDMESMLDGFTWFMNSFWDVTHAASLQIPNLDEGAFETSILL